MSARPGPLNLITDVAGLRVGQADDPRVRTGVTVILAEAPAVAAGDVRGGGPGTRETDLLAADMLVEAVDAIVLSGGSAYGLGAADGVAAALGAAGRGYTFGPGIPPAPIVPAAILFDLANGGDKGWGETPPYPALGRAALRAASEAPDGRFALGSAGAGYGAKAGAIRGGTGSASLVGDEGFTVGAIACVNSFGSVIMPGRRCFWAWPFEQGTEYGGLRPDPSLPASDPDDWGLAKRNPGLRENTTIAVVATDAALTPAQARRFAVMAQDGLARAIRPAHAPFDGDVVFALATSRRALPDPANHWLTTLAERAATCLARAIARSVYEADSWPESAAPAWRDLGW